MTVPSRTARPWAYLSVLGAGTLWGTSGPFSVALFQMGLPPESVALLRTAVGGAFLGLFLLVLNPRGFKHSGRTLLWMAGAGGLIVGVFQLSFQMSTKAIGVPSTVALLYLAPAFVVATSPFVLGERLSIGRATLAAVSVVGVALTVAGSGGADVPLTVGGVVWGILCGVTYGSYTMFGRILSPRHGPLAPLFFSTAGGVAVLGLAFVLLGIRPILPATPAAWGVVTLFGLTTIAMAAILLFYALRALDAGRAAIGTTIEPFVAALLAITLLGESVAPHGWLGLALLVVGVSGAYSLGAPRPTDAGRSG